MSNVVFYFFQVCTDENNLDEWNIGENKVSKNNIFNIIQTENYEERTITNKST